MPARSRHLISRKSARNGARASAPRSPRDPRSQTVAKTEVKVPDIGNYDNVPVIEVLVKAGDTVAKDQGLVTLESDKATMEVPAPFAGMIVEVKVKVGDALSEGSVVAVIEAAGAAAAAPQPKSEAPKTPAATPAAKVENAATAPSAGTPSGRKADIECQVCV